MARAGIVKNSGTIARILAHRQAAPDGDLRPCWKRGIGYQQFQQSPP
jgi:hypothetical protein